MGARQERVLRLGPRRLSPEISALWEKLSAGATVVQPLAPSGWIPLYGMLKDRFGVTWVLDTRRSTRRPEPAKSARRADA
jgi:uncharacterized glyoxalase superfamily protein PhnB